MSETAPLLFRHLLLRPLVLSLFPLLAGLWALDHPVRRSLEADEARTCAGRLRAAVLLARGTERPPSALPSTWLEDPRDRFVLLDGDGRVALDTKDPRATLMESWLGPPEGVPLRFTKVAKARGRDGLDVLRCEVRWDHAGRAGGIVLLSSLVPLQQRIRSLQLGTVALWCLWAVLVGFLGLHGYRRLLAERAMLLACLDGIPEVVADPVMSGEGLLDLERAAQAAARRARATVGQLREDLREREAVLLGMLEGVLAVDARREVVLINPSAERMLGLETGTGRGRRVAELVKNGAFQNFVEEILEEGRVGEIEFALEGGIRQLRTLGDALRGRQGEVRGAVLVMGDVTEIRRLERIRREFVANVSHELKTPITAIQGYVETLLEGEVSPADRQRFLSVVANNVHRMNRIIEDLLALARVESAGVEIEKSPFPVSPMVERIVRDAGAEAARRDKRLETQLPPESIWLDANEALLERALGNLVDNALKYGAAGSVVRVRTLVEAGSVRFEVQDEGPGIGAVHLPRLFERFYRVDKGRSRELGGTGLGLAIVKHIALAHTGETWVESRLGAGSTFFLRIPGASPNPPPAHAAAGD